MSLGTSNRDGGRTSESGHLRPLLKGLVGEVLTGLAVSQRGAGANMSVDIAIGDAMIPRADGTYGHPCFNDAVYNQAIDTADVSNPRRDIVVMYVDYDQAPSTGISNNTNGVVKIKSVTGTPAGSPVDPTDGAIQSSVGAGNPFVKLARIRVAAGAASVTNSVIDDLRLFASAVANGGWNALGSAWDVWTFSAWDNTNKLATINVPNSAIFTLGQKVKYWQSTGGWKFGFIVRLPNGTSIQVYQGHVGGFTLNNERIYLPHYSRDKSPDGFPINPNIWTVEVTDNALRTQANAATNTWYNINAFQIAVPVGLWKLSYKIVVQRNPPSGTVAIIFAALSTSNNSASDLALATAGEISGSAVGSHAQSHYNEKVVDLTANTPYYMIAKHNDTNLGQLYWRGDYVLQVLRAVCAYL